MSPMVAITTNKLLIRQVRLSDVAAIAAIEQQCFSPSEAAAIEVLRRRAALYPEGFLVAERDGEVLGYANSGATDSDDISAAPFKHLVGHNPDGRNLAIFGLAVRPDVQGSGVSRHLLEAYTTNARNLGKAAILLLCKEHLVEFYERFAFENAGDSASTHGGFRWKQMRLKL